MRSRWSRVSLRAASRPATFDFSLWQVTQYRSRTARWVEAGAVPEAFEDCSVGPVAWPAATRAVTTIAVQPTTSSRFFIGRPVPDGPQGSILRNRWTLQICQFTLDRPCAAAIIHRPDRPSNKRRCPMRALVKVATVLSWFVFVPALAHAQASITGIVKDPSGAVLPGVTVEAASPELIEKVRAATTDGSGQYRIVDLRPGTYAVTFTLVGFSTVKREGFVLPADFVSTLSVDLKIGALEETITVSGESPIVDVQTVTKRRTLDLELIQSIPTARG